MIKTHTSLLVMH